MSLQHPSDRSKTFNRAHCVEWSADPTMIENTSPDSDKTLTHIRANAALVMEHCTKLCGFKFGFDAKSVEWLDGFIQRTRNSPSAAENNEKWVSIYGSYLGEAIIQCYGGSWARNESGWHIRFDDKNGAFPFNKVRKQLQFGEEDSIASFFDAIPALFFGNRQMGSRP